MCELWRSAFELSGCVIFELFELSLFQISSGEMKDFISTAKKLQVYICNHSSNDDKLLQVLPPDVYKICSIPLPVVPRDDEFI